MLRFLHVGKTGGSAIKDVLVRRLALSETPFGTFAHQGADELRLQQVPSDDYFFFCVRDPIARFVSAYYSRYYKGKPLYYSAWGSEEAEAFERFPSPQQLAGGLASNHLAESRAARRAMNSIRHLRRMSDELGSARDVRARMDKLVYVGRQETLDADFQHLRVILGLPADSALPSGDVRAHRRTTLVNDTFNAEQLAALRAWYADDFELLGLCEQVRARHGWGQPIPGLSPGREPDGTARSLLDRDSPLSQESLEVFLRHPVPPSEIWAEVLTHERVKRVAELGTFRGKLAQDILNRVASIDTYYLLGPDERTDGRFPVNDAEDDFAKAIDRTHWETYPQVISGDPFNTLSKIADGCLDAAILGYGFDRSLRSVTIALHRVWSKIRPGGIVGGFGFDNRVFVRGVSTEPSFVFPYAKFFAEAAGAPIYRLPHNQFLIVKTAESFAYFDLTREGSPDTVLELWRAARWMAPIDAQRMRRRGRSLANRLRHQYQQFRAR